MFFFIVYRVILGTGLTYIGYEYNIGGGFRERHNVFNFIRVARIVLQRSSIAITVNILYCIIINTLFMNKIGPVQFNSTQLHTCIV